MSDHPIAFNFAAALEGAADHPLTYTSKVLEAFSGYMFRGPEKK